jgi:type I restriction-modification system DNA methylase subunit
MLSSPTTSSPTSSRQRQAIAALLSPPSHKHRRRTANAAIAAVTDSGRDVATIIAEHRALGAPLLFLIAEQQITVWQVRSEGPPRRLAHTTSENLSALFAVHKESWNPDAIHRAKSIGAIDRAYQLDFVDAGLLPMVEGQVHAKLDRLIDETLTEALRHHLRARAHLDERFLFRTTFRLLAAKVLQDRGHDLTTTWDPNRIESVLEAITRYYRLSRLPKEPTELQREVFGTAWERLRGGINFRNISADDLSFVYEHTLITPETRKHFGTHSTPRQVAEYVVSRLELWRHDCEDLRVYEPFTGSGVFLVAALRHLRDLLPHDWNDQRRHEFLVERIAGDEIDASACEVATLSLILADYPNANGWKISERDLFASDVLTKRARQANIILCNPPFEAFAEQDRKNYPAITRRAVTKGAAVLNSILDARPTALGFVLPRGFLNEQGFLDERRRLEKLFVDIELVALPEGTFKFSTIESALLIAKSPRETTNARSLSLRSSVVTQRDRDAFLQFGKISSSRSQARATSDGAIGELWIRELDEPWRYLASYPTFSVIADIHRGIEWRGEQSRATSQSAKPGYRRGLHSADSVRPFIFGRPLWLDTRTDQLRRAVDLPWDRPKIVANAVRLSRGPRRLAAAVDTSGLVCSQQLFGCWTKRGRPEELAVLAAVLNGPVANAFVAVHSPSNRVRVSTMQALPLPLSLPLEVAPLVAAYVDLVSASALEVDPTRDRRVARLLDEIDALVLKSYDLPPRLERELLEMFRDSDRPTVHTWRHWLPTDFVPAVPLHEYLSGEYAKARKNWLIDVFTPLPEAEAALVRDYME